MTETTELVECDYFVCGACRIVYYPGMFSDEHPPPDGGVIWAGPIEGNEESLNGSCPKKEVCNEYKPKGRCVK